MPATAPLGLALTYAQVKALKPCADDFARIAKAMGPAWKKHNRSAAEARKLGATFDDVMWIASAAARVDPGIERRLRLWLCDCAMHVLHIYERDYPNDMRPREAVLIGRRFARKEVTVAARAAARAAAWDAAWAAARDAARDAARAAAGDAARAAARAAARDAAMDAEQDWQFDRLIVWLSAEQDWQFDRLIAWLSDPEPADWPLPVQQNEVAA
jgi:hypothetical protein